MTKTLNKYWGKLLGGLINLLYFTFFFILCCLIISDVFFFGKMTMPETPAYIFIIFFLAPAIYAVKLGLGTFVRLVEFVIPQLIVIYGLLVLLVLPKLELTKLLPVMAEGIKPVLGGAIPNLNFPFAQILPIAFYYKFIKADKSGGNKFIIFCFLGIVAATILLTFRALASAAAFDQMTLQTLTYPPFSTIRLIEVGEILERLDALLLGIFYLTTFFKFIITYYIICQIISDCFQAGKPEDFALPVAVLLGISMPLLIPRFDVILDFVVPYFFLFLPIFFPIPILLYATIKVRDKSTQENKKKLQGQ